MEPSHLSQGSNSRGHASGRHAPGSAQLTMNQPDAGSRPSKPDGIPFSLALPHHALNGTIVICPHISNPGTVAIELQLAGTSLASAALTEEGALDLALRLLGTVMDRRRAA